VLTDKIGDDAENHTAVAFAGRNKAAILTAGIKRSPSNPFA